MKTVCRLLLVAICGLIVTEVVSRRDWSNIGLLVLMTAAFWRPAFEKEPLS